MTDAQLTGEKAESAVCDKLAAGGCEIVARNFRAGNIGEIDIVARKNNKYLFVEVKARQNSSFWGGPEASITRKKLKNMKNIVSVFSKKNNLMNNEIILLAAFVHLKENREIGNIDLISLEML